MGVVIVVESIHESGGRSEIEGDLKSRVGDLTDTSMNLVMEMVVNQNVDREGFGRIGCFFGGSFDREKRSVNVLSKKNPIPNSFVHILKSCWENDLATHYLSDLNNIPPV